MFDRMIFRGHPMSFFPKDAFLRFLLSQKILLKNFGWYVQTMTRILKGHVQGIAAEAGREVIYLNSAMTTAREIARRDGISYQRYDNTFLKVQRMAEVQKLCQRFVSRKWVRVLEAFARQVNPLCQEGRQALREAPALIPDRAGSVPRGRVNEPRDSRSEESRCSGGIVWQFGRCFRGGSPEALRSGEKCEIVSSDAAWLSDHVICACVSS